MLNTDKEKKKYFKIPICVSDLSWPTIMCEGEKLL